jgi:hypothetical protein
MGKLLRHAPVHVPEIGAADRRGLHSTFRQQGHLKVKINRGASPARWGELRPTGNAPGNASVANSLPNPD